MKQLSLFKNLVMLMMFVLVPTNVSAQNNTEKMAPCPICAGRGSVFISLDFSMFCLACNGSGKVLDSVAKAYAEQQLLRGTSGGTNSSSSPNSYGTRKKDCRVCYNTGLCQGCNGRGEVINSYTNRWSYCNTCNKNYQNANNPRRKGKCYACSW